MKSALSIRYGGLLIDAEDCNYNSFKHLGLICPICKRSIFLVAESQRGVHSRKKKDGTTTQVKEHSVPAHFSHHADVSKDQVLDCELRSQSMSVTTRQAIAAKARGQRLKTMQRHFWKICSTSVKLIDIEGMETVQEEVWRSASGRSPEASKRLYQILIDSLVDQFRVPGQVDHTKATVLQGIETWINQVKDPFLCPPKMQILLKLWEQKLDLKMQELIVCEAIDFVIQKMQTPILKKLVEIGVYSLTQAAASSILYGQNQKERLIEFNKIGRELEQTEIDKMGEAMILATRSFIGMDKSEFENAFYFVRDDVVQCLSFVNWAEEFEKLEKLEIDRIPTPA